MPAATAAARSEAAHKAWATRRARAMALAEARALPTLRPLSPSGQRAELAEQLEAVRAENARLRKGRGLPMRGKATPQIAAIPGTSPLGFVPEPVDLEAVLREAEAMIDVARAESAAHPRIMSSTYSGEFQHDAHVEAWRVHTVDAAIAIATDFVRERGDLWTEGVHLDAYHSGEQYRIHAIVRPKQSVTLCGQRPVYGAEREESSRLRPSGPFSQTYGLGDSAIYGGFNFNYFGHVTSIGAKTVSIKEDHGSRGHRLTISRFASWNDDDQRFEHDRRANWSD